MYNLLLLSILRSCGISSETCYLTDDYWIFLSTGLQRNAALWLYHQVKKLQQPASVLQTGAWAPSLDLQSALEREKRQNIPSNNTTEKPLSKAHSSLPLSSHRQCFSKPEMFHVSHTLSCEQWAATPGRVSIAPGTGRGRTLPPHYWPCYSP